MKTIIHSIRQISLIIAGFLVMLSPAAHAINIGERAPEFVHQNTQDWINTSPLTIDDLKGEVFLVDFWTFACWNCYRSFPWLNDLEARYKDQGFSVIGVHSPEFKYEHDRDSVVAKVDEFDLHHPIMIDNDFSYWRAFDNQYWPTYYLFDKRGVLRATYIGETHVGDKRAKAVEKKVKALLAED